MLSEEGRQEVDMSGFSILRFLVLLLLLWNLKVQESDGKYTRRDNVRLVARVRRTPVGHPHHKVLHNIMLHSCCYSVSSWGKPELLQNILIS